MCWSCFSVDTWWYLAWGFLLTNMSKWFTLLFHEVSGRSSNVMIIFLLRWIQVCRTVLPPVWSLKLLSSLTKTPTGWPPSLLPVGSCSCCATMVMGRTARLTFGVISWQLIYTPLAGVSRTRRFSKCLKVLAPYAEAGSTYISMLLSFVSMVGGLHNCCNAQVALLWWQGEVVCHVFLKSCDLQ